MTSTATKLKRALCSMVAMLALMAGIAAVPALAASNGIYTATAVSHYRHPTTGVIEDSGGEGSYVLGQSMTDSALNKAALVEVDSQGNTYVTIRLNLMDNIQSPQFQVDGSRNGSFTAASATVMQEDYINNTTDFRMQVPDENAIIRCNMYVVPMGRDVVFYITVGDLQSGSGDFVTSIKVEQPVQEPEEPVQSEQSVTSTPATQAPVADTSSSEAPASETSSSTPEVSFSDTGSISSDEAEDAVDGLAEFDASGEKVSVTSTKAGQEGSTGNPVVWWVIGGIIVVAIAGGCVWYFCFFRKKK